MPSLWFRWRILVWTKGDFRGSLYWGKYWECYFQGSSCEIWQISMEFLCFRGHYILWGIITLLREPLRDLGKSQLEFLHLGGLWGDHCEIWENLNGVSSLGGVMRESLRDLGKSQWSSFTLGVYKGIKQLYQRCRWRILAWTNEINCMLYQLKKSSVLILSKGNNDKICPVLVWSMSDL